MATLGAEHDETSTTAGWKSESPNGFKWTKPLPVKFKQICRSVIINIYFRVMLLWYFFQMGCYQTIRLK